MKKIGYLGPNGSFSEEAIHLFLATHSEVNEKTPQLIPFPTIPRLLFACNDQEID